MTGKFSRALKNFFNQPRVSKGLLEKGVLERCFGEKFPKILIVVLALKSKPKKGEFVVHTQLRLTNLSMPFAGNRMNLSYL